MPEETAVLEEVENLAEFVESPAYRESLGFPEVVRETYHVLAQGEYNRNFWFDHPFTGERLVLRVNFGSQMHLENQIEYEFQALRQIESSGRTPRPMFMDGSLKVVPHGLLVMSYLSGESLDYRRSGDLRKAAHILADIHSVRIQDDTSLISSEHPLREILTECESMIKVYDESDLADPETKKLIRRCMDRAWVVAKAMETEIPYRCCINTELNNTNFLITPGDSDELGGFLVDWEKPLYGDPAQDLGHFLAPTTTFWKTDVILDAAEKRDFIEEYVRAVDGRFDTIGMFERTEAFEKITCLRGITWCAMAWVQYQEDSDGLRNESTRKKLNDYVNPDFIRTYGWIPE